MAEANYIPRLKTHYSETLRGQLSEKFGYKNVMEIPQLDKVVLNMGIGEATTDTKKGEVSICRYGINCWSTPSCYSCAKLYCGF